MTSHAAVVAKEVWADAVLLMRGEITIKEEEKYFIDKNGRRYNEGGLDFP